MPQKRPLGLSKSKGKPSGSEPSAKRVKQTPAGDDGGTTTETQSLTEDWEDLQELFARAVTAYGLGGVVESSTQMQ
jgi:hypothetical protein